MSDNPSTDSRSFLQKMMYPRENKLLYVGIIFFGVVASCVYVLDAAVNRNTVGTEFAISFIGIVTFFSVLFTNYLITDSNSLDQGEVRRAIAASIISVYLALVPFGVLDDAVNLDDETATIATETEDGTLVITEDSQGEIKNDTIQQLGSVVKYIIVFYFGSRTVSTVATGAAAAYGSSRRAPATTTATTPPTTTATDDVVPLG